MITLELFLDNAVKSWQFALDAAWDQHRRHPELSRGKCLMERSFLRTLLGTDQAPVFSRACEMADTVTDKKDMQVLLPDVLTWMQSIFPPQPDHPDYEPGRSFRYNILEKNNYCYLHIRNAKQPESFLKDPAYVVENLRYIMDKAEREHGCCTLYTATWLNSLPAFLRFFPAEWQNNLSHTPPDQIGATLGFQGQFINRYGFLNEITAAQYLQTGVLPYARQEAFCSFEAVRNHLNTLKF